MDVFTSSGKIVVTCYKRLSPYLENEIKELGYTPTRVFSTGVELEGTVKDCIRLNLNLFCGAHVLYSLTGFNARNADELYRQVNSFSWEELISDSGYFSVTSKVFNESIDTPLFANVKVKDAIVDRIRTKSKKRPDSGSELRGVVVHLHWMEDRAEIFLDTSGETISKHGYRKIPGSAPMLESLATATLLATGWDRKSPFVNPMCGSGTLAIEAALLATNRKPGLFRDNYSFMHVLEYDPMFYKEERDRIEEEINDNIEVKIIATDIDKDIVEKAKLNAQTAGVEQWISFDNGDFENTEVPPGGNGVVFFNPEYGERLGDETELIATYRRIGDFLKQKCQGYKGFVFTGNLNLAKQIGLKASRRTEFFSAKIDCRLLAFELYSGTRRPQEN